MFECAFDSVSTADRTVAAATAATVASKAQAV
jgi:hypothetical protein